MLTTRRVVGPLRILLALAFAALVLAQVAFLPALSGAMAEDSPELACLRWPTLTVAVLGLGCVQVVIVCTWKLLTLVRQDSIFRAASFRWVNGIVWAFVCGWLLLAGLAVYLTAVIYFTPRLRDPGIPIVLFGMVLFGAVLVLLLLVLRALLRQATALRTDMEAVI